MTINTAPATLPWYKSKIIWGLIVAIVGPLLKASGLISQWGDADSGQLADAIVACTTSAGGLLAFGARLTQKHAPNITLAKKG